MLRCAETRQRRRRIAAFIHTPQSTIRSLGRSALGAFTSGVSAIGSGFTSFFRPPSIAPLRSPSFVGPPAPTDPGGLGTRLLGGVGTIAGGILGPLFGAAPEILQQAGTSFLAGKLNRALSLPGGAPVRQITGPLRMSGLPFGTFPPLPPLGPMRATRPISAARPTRSGFLGVSPAVTRPTGLAQATGLIPGLVGPGGAMPAFPVSRAAFGFGTEGLGGLAELTERIGGLVGGQTTLFRQGMARVIPVREITERNPMTGRIEVWRHMGRAILFSGDLACAKRVSKIARRARVRSRSFR